MCSNGFRILIMFLFTILSFVLNNYFTTIPVVIWYIISINLFSFILFGIDKINSLKDRRRVSEYTFYYISIIGGIFGILIGTLVFRHKSKNKKFILIEFIITLCWSIFIYFIYSHLDTIQNILK